jgi:hypothetical protein
MSIYFGSEIVGDGEVEELDFEHDGDDGCFVMAEEPVLVDELDGLEDELDAAGCGEPQWSDDIEA